MSYKFNILVTAISGDVANSILKCLKHSDVVNNLFGCDIYQYPCGINKVNRNYVVAPCCDTYVYLNQLLSIVKENKIDLIIPTNEHEILCLSKNRKLFWDMGIKLLIHDESIYDVFFSKFNTSSLLKKLGLPYINTCYADHIDINLNFPVIIKNDFGSGSKGIDILFDKSELEGIDLSHSKVIQEYIGNPDLEFTVPVFSKNEGKDIFAIPFRRTLSKAGYTNFLEPASKEICEKALYISSKIAQSIKLRGAIDLQFRLENDQLYLFECNPRLSGTAYFRHLLEFKDVNWWVSLVMGIDNDIQFTLPCKKYVGIRELNEEIIYL